MDPAGWLVLWVPLGPKNRILAKKISLKSPRGPKSRFQIAVKTAIFGAMTIASGEITALAGASLILDFICSQAQHLEPKI